MVTWTCGAKSLRNRYLSRQLPDRQRLDLLCDIADGTPAIVRGDATRLRQVIVNEPFARKFFDGRALGRTFRISPESASEPSRDVAIIGIVGGTMKRADTEGPLLYLPATFERLETLVAAFPTAYREDFDAETAAEVHLGHLDAELGRDPGMQGEHPASRDLEARGVEDL